MIEYVKLIMKTSTLYAVWRKVSLSIQLKRKQNIKG